MKTRNLVTASVLLAAPVFAQANHYGHAYNREPTLYVMAGLGASEYDFSPQDVRYSFGDGSLNSIRTDNESSSWRIGLGYRITNMVSLEFGYVDLGEFSADAQSDGSQIFNNGYAAGPVDIDGEGDATFVGVSLHTPDHEPVGAYLRAGIHGWEVEGTVADSTDRGRYLVDGVDPYIGGGVRFTLDRNIQLQVGYDLYMMDDDPALDMKVGILSADLTFYF